MSRYNFSSDSYLPDDRDERERDAEIRSDAEREEQDNDDFQPCGKCDLPDACADFGCALKNGVRKWGRNNHIDNW